MGTNKKVIQIILENEYAEKFEYLRELDDRSASKMGYKMIKHYIDQYEKQNGKIITKNTEKYPLNIPYGKK